MPESSVSVSAAGIFRAARDGSVDLIDRILAQQPELLTIDNPYQWVRYVPRHEVRGSYSKKPVEVAAFFDRPGAVAKLLEIARDSHAIGKPWEDHLAFDGFFNCLSVARSLKHNDVIQVIENEVRYRLNDNPQLLDASASDGRTILHYAASQGHMPLVRELIERGAAVDSQTKSGHRAIHAVLDTPIDDAAETPEEKSERLAVARLLVENGAKFDLWIAAALGDTAHASQLLSQDASRANINYRPDKQRFSAGFPIVRAAYSGHTQIVEMLLDHGADINTDLGEDPREFAYSVVAAMEGNHWKTVNFLLDRGISINAHGYCVPPFVDELYIAAMRATAPAGSQQHLISQPIESTTPAAVATYQRVLAMNSRPRSSAFVTMQDHAEVERLLRESLERHGRKDTTGEAHVGPENECSSIANSAAWQGDLASISLCLEICPDDYSTKLANDCIVAAIRSHNRYGSFDDYRRIIELHLNYLKENHATVDCCPLWLLAEDFLECYRYGDTPDQPNMEHLLNLAELFIEFGANVNEVHESTSRTALTNAVNKGYFEYVELLLSHGATIQRDNPPNSNPILIARKHGFDEILQLLDEDPTFLGELTESDLFEIQSPVAGQPPIASAPMRNAVIRMGVVTVEGKLQPKHKPGDTLCVFVPFPESFPTEQFANVRVIISNRNHPQVIGSATTGTRDSAQGFLLKVRNSKPENAEAANQTDDADANEAANRSDSTVTDVSFSWLAVLLTDQPQPKRYEVRYGLIPWRELRGYAHHRYTDVGDLYASNPLPSATGEKFVFLTTTESNVVNGAASMADQNGLLDLESYQVSRHDGGGRIYWMVICETPIMNNEASTNGRASANAITGPTKREPAETLFDFDDLWFHTARTEPIEFIRAGLPSAWRRDWVQFPVPFRERRPCTFISSNQHGVQGHHASVMAMAWNGTRTDFPITGLTVDPIRGQSSFDCITIGHIDIQPQQATAARQQTQPSAWELMAGADDAETWFQLALLGKIGVNEFGPRGGSLLMHCVYERHERIHTALARRLFAIGADPNLAHPVTHMTALHLAAFLKRKDMTRLLIQRGANVNAKTVPGTKSPFPTPHNCASIGRDPLGTHWSETPLHLAMRQRNFAIVEVLLEAGADPNAEDANGDRPIDYLPNWFASPDKSLHWQLTNHRKNATAADLVALIRSFEN